MKNITESAGVVALGTIISRILGYLRDMFVAHIFGATMFADAFYAAYRIPNLFRRLLGEGSVSAAVIPVLSEYHVTRDKKKTIELISILTTALVIVLAVITLLGIVFSRQVVTLIAHGWVGEQEKFNLTVTLTQLMFPFLLFISLAALSLGILNTIGKFFVPSVAPASLSISEIVFILIIAPLLCWEDQIKGLAISVVAGGAGQFLIQLPFIIKAGFLVKPNFHFNNPGFKKITSLMLPSTIGMSVDQINAFADTICASFLTVGSITALYYSNRLMQLPLAVFAIAVASVALPAMSQATAKNDLNLLKNTLSYSIRLLLFALLPSMAGLMIFGLPIIQLLFERGRFDTNASLLTHSALFFYSLGLPAYGIVKILASTFYSLKETKTPVKVATTSMLLNIILNVLLMYELEVAGLALATTISSYFNAFWLFVILRRKIGHIGATKIINAFLKILLASATMCVLTWLIFTILPQLFPTIKEFTNITTTMTILFAVFCYITLAYIFRIEELSEIRKIIAKKLPFLG